MRRAHLLTTKAGYTTLTGDHGFFAHNVNQMLGAGFPATSAADALIREDDGIGTLTAKEVVKEASCRKEALFGDDRIRQYKRGISGYQVIANLLYGLRVT